MRSSEESVEKTTDVVLNLAMKLEQKDKHHLPPPRVMTIV